MSGDIWKFTVGERIYAAFDENQAPDWNENNRFDASPDGLSGKKEGFYFANWLMPFKTPFIFNGISISPVDYPECLKNDDFNCQTCQFFEIKSCPILTDIINMELTQMGFKTYQKLIYWPRGNEYSIFEAVQKELLSHGRALHYQLITKMLKIRYPNLGVTDRNVHKVLKFNPLFFAEIGEGAYQAIPGIFPGHESPFSVLIGDLFN